MYFLNGCKIVYFEGRSISYQEMDFFSSPNRPRKTTKKTANKNLIYKKALNITNFISLLLFISKKSVTLHRVFHSIRFKVNKGWVRALTLFLYPYCEVGIFFCSRKKKDYGEFHSIPQPLTEASFINIFPAKSTTENQSFTFSKSFCAK